MFPSTLARAISLGGSPSGTPCRRPSCGLANLARSRSAEPASGPLRRRGVPARAPASPHGSGTRRRFCNMYGQTEANSSTYHWVGEIPRDREIPCPSAGPCRTSRSSRSAPTGQPVVEPVARASSTSGRRPSQSGTGETPIDPPRRSSPIQGYPRGRPGLQDGRHRPSRLERRLRICRPQGPHDQEPGLQGRDRGDRRSVFATIRRSGTRRSSRSPTSASATGSRHSSSRGCPAVSRGTTSSRTASRSCPDTWSPRRLHSSTPCL